MAQLPTESLDWLDRLEVINASVKEDPTLTQAAFIDRFKASPAHVSYLFSLRDCLDQAAIDKIRQASKGNPPHTFSFNNAIALIGLKKASNPPAAVHTVLDAALAQRLPTLQIKALVIWVIQGNPAETFDPSQKPHPSADKALRQSNPGTRLEASSQMKSSEPEIFASSLDLKKFRQFLEKAEAERIQGNETTAQEKLETHIQKVAASLAGFKSSKKSPGSDEILSETVLLDWIADIDVVKQLKAKRKKGKSLTAGEWGLLVLHKFGECWGHLVKFILRMFKPFLKLLRRIWKLVIEALKVLGLYPYAQAIFTLMAVIATIWFAWEAFHYGVMRPVEMVWSKMHFRHAVEDSPTPVPTPQPLVSIASPASAGISSPFRKTSARDTRTQQPPVVAYVPSVSFKTTDFDPKLLEQEIAAIPTNSVIKDYVFQPDEGMPADLAVSRLQDLTDADKYTMMIGGGKQKILSVTPSNTNFIITYQSTDPLGLFGNSSATMNIFLEDIKYIHINEIDHFSKPGAPPDIQYQCTVVAKGEKYLLTIQCGSKDDLENLVSTLEYFIRHSRLSPNGGLGHDAQPGGMPYPTQGIKLNNDCVVTLLWANSPMDKAGLVLGDMLWSVDINAYYPPDRKKLEASLAGLAPGSHTLFAVSPADRDKAQSNVSFNRASSFNPKRRKVTLAI